MEEEKGGDRTVECVIVPAKTVVRERWVQSANNFRDKFYGSPPSNLIH